MTDLDVVKDFANYANATGVKSYKTKEAHHKQTWECTTYKRDEIFRIVCDFYPYLCARRRAKCDEFLQWYAAKEGMKYD